MAAPVASLIQLLDDAANTGKKLRTTTRDVGGNTVHEHFFRISRGRHQAANSGSNLEYGPSVYSVASAILSAAASAHNGTSTGHLWIHNPGSSSIRAAIRRIRMEHSLSSNTTNMTPMRLAAALFTFTGTASGSSLTPAKHHSGYPTATVSARTAVTGLTVTVGALLMASLAPTTVGTAGWTPLIPGFDQRQFTDDGQPILLPGEGLLIYQPDAGVSSDTRRHLVEVEWEEFD